MRRKFTYLLLSAFLLVGGGQAMADRHDNGGKARQEQRNNHRPGNGGNPSGNKNHNGSGNKNHNAGNKNHNGGNKNNGFGNKNHNGGSKNHFGNDKKHDNKHNDKHFGKPGNQGHPGNQGRPGNQGHGNQGRPGGGHDNFRPGGHKPGAPVPPPAPVMRPGAGAAFHPGPAMPPPPPPRLPHMVNYATRGCHDVAVWQVDAETFLVKYRRGGRWYTRYVYPYAEEYGAPTLISVNWQPLSPWTLIPPIQLNINL